MKKIILKILLITSMAIFWFGCKKEKEQLGGIYGMVINAMTEEPISIASVELGTAKYFNDNGIPIENIVLKRTVTSDDGQYEFPEIDAGDSYYVKVTMIGYEEQYDRVLVQKNEQKKIDILLLPNEIELLDIGIMVQKTDIVSGAVNWYIAKELCEKTTVNGYSDWRLPTLSELSAIYNKSFNIGRFRNSFYWSSTKAGNSSYYLIDFRNGSTTIEVPSDSYINSIYASESGNTYCRCIRSLKFSEP